MVALPLVPLFERLFKEKDEIAAKFLIFAAFRRRVGNGLLRAFSGSL